MSTQLLERNQETGNKTSVLASADTRKSLWSKQVVLVAIVVACGLVLRLNGLTFDSFWLDEAYQTMVESVGVKFDSLEKLADRPTMITLGEPRSLSTVLSNFRQVDPLCPPLYAVALNRWMHLFGTGDFAVRALSTVFSMLSMIVIYLGASKLFNRRVGLAALMIAAVSPYDISYAQEARMYTLLALSSAISCFSLLYLIRSIEQRCKAPRKLLFLATYSLSTFAVVNSHYTGGFLVAFQGLYGIAYALYRKDLRLLAWLTGGWSLFLLFWAPWFQMFLEAARVRDNFYVSRDGSLLWPLKGAVIGKNWLSFLSGGRVAALAIPIYATSAAIIATAAGIAAVQYSATARKALSGLKHTWLGRLLPCLRSRFEARSGNGFIYGRQALVFVCLWAVIPALVALTTDIAGNRKTIEISRYLICTAPALYILAGIAVTHILRLGLAGRLLIVFHIVFALTNYAYAHTVPQREPWRQMAGIIESRVDTSELLLVSPHYDIVCLNRYLTAPRMQVGTGPLLGNQHIYGVLEGRKSCWLLTAQAGESVAVFIPPRLKARETIELSHSLKLTHYREDKQTESR